MDSIYLDHNATTPVLPDVAAAMAECDAQGYANPASAHRAGRRARQILEDAREGIGEMLGCRFVGERADRLIFTSGGTEANNLAILGIAGGESARGTVIISAIEHPSITGPATHLPRRGWGIGTLGVSRQGSVVADALSKLLREAATGRIPPVRLVSVMLGNNETGVVQPVAELAAISREAGVPMHTDAVQAVGKQPVNVRQLDVSALSVAAHKFHGPRGIGALLLRHDATLQPRLHGGFQQGGLRPGTESVTLAVGMFAALRSWHANQSERIRHLQTLRDRFEHSLLAARPTAVVNGADAERLPQTSNVAFPGFDRQALFLALDMAGVACSTGSACASGSSDPSPTLIAMGCDDAIVRSALRFSFGVENTLSEIDEAVKRIADVCGRF